MPKIMVVDDEVVITTRLEEHLTSMGYEVIGEASSGEESIDMARHLRPDLILMDIVMPGKLDGIDAAERIKAELDIPVIFLTAYADDKFVERAKEVEPFGFIVKPFQEKEIRASIEVALHKKDMERRLRESEEKYRFVVDNASDALISVDSHGNITFWNHGAETTFGYSADEIISLPIISIMPERFRGYYEDEMSRMVLTGKSNIIGKVVECSGLRKDGSEFPMLFYLAFWKTGGEIFFTGIVRDISEWVEEQEGLIPKIQDTSAKVKISSKPLPICTSCKKIRDDKGNWNQIEAYLYDHFEMGFSHGLCPDCAKKLYPEYYKGDE